MARVVRDALQGKHCFDCKFYHNPLGNPTGFCVEGPPIRLIAGMQPDPEDLKKAQAKQMMQQRLATPQTQGPVQVKMVPITYSYVPEVGDEDGCWKHVKVEGEVVIAPDIQPLRPM